MKKARILIAASLFALSGAVLTSCGAESENTQSEQSADAVYQCPMDCEDGKTYNENGQCPLCEMDLEEIDA
ncbi:heavy metal-binding domain-containing protein [Brumimicrobium aurantiacum]|uniref:Heavy metal binding domain-containing protein n=1 Tax=Brumimicrobium aurantiacum TaxID=1737063 RepID=A0A3E1EW07_9FLAO|nr:heavy metal-binding domain-containing protein [Brumimicrobium aurantiacum]RFC53673.1 hypothetical protein DXU93_11125 [Brumimicrobium aurantiacum]